MRRIAVALAALLMAAGTTPVLAGGGTPKLTNVDAGPYLAELFNDSPSLVTGANGLTIQIRGLTVEHVVSLALEGPTGQRVPVPLTRVIMVGALEDDDHSHAEDGDDHTTEGDRHVEDGDSHGLAGAAGSGHDNRPVDVDNASADSHDAEAAEAHGHAAETETYLARGSASLPTTGTWTAHLTIRDSHGEEVVGRAPLAVVEGGPSKLYLGVAGSLIFGSMLFGLIERRRQDRAVTTRTDTTRIVASQRGEA